MSFAPPDPQLLQPFLEAGRISQHDVDMFDQGLRYLRWDMRVGIWVAVALLGARELRRPAQFRFSLWTLGKTAAAGAVGMVGGAVWGVRSMQAEFGDHQSTAEIFRKFKLLQDLKRHEANPSLHALPPLKPSDKHLRVNVKGAEIELPPLPWHVKQRRRDQATGLDDRRLIDGVDINGDAVGDADVLERREEDRREGALGQGGMDLKQQVRLEMARAMQSDALTGISSSPSPSSWTSSERAEFDRVQSLKAGVSRLGEGSTRSGSESGSAEEREEERPGADDLTRAWREKHLPAAWRKGLDWLGR